MRFWCYCGGNDDDKVARWWFSVFGGSPWFCFCSTVVF